MVLLALDYGEKRIGVAVTDESGKFVKALEYIPNKSEVRKISGKDFPPGTNIEDINKARKEHKDECKMEFRKICTKLVFLITCYYAEKIIIGLPTLINFETSDTKIGMQGKKVQKFAKEIQSCLKSKNISVEIELIEESMTSNIAEQNLINQGVQDNKIKEKIDSESARILLEEYISKK